MRGLLEIKKMIGKTKTHSHAGWKAGHRKCHRAKEKEMEKMREKSEEGSRREL